MKRKIKMGNNSQYIEKAATVNQYNQPSDLNMGLPDDITQEQWNEFIEFMIDFLNSKEAENMSVSNYKMLESKVSDAKKNNHSNDWENFRNLLADTANMTTILAPIAKFISSNSSEIVQWIQKIF